MHEVAVGSFGIDATGDQRAVRGASSRPPATSPRPSGSASAVFHLAVRGPGDVARARRGDPVVAASRGATGAHPEGPRSDVGERADHPVVHVSAGTTPRPTAPGPAGGCRPRPSGSTPPAAGSTAARYPWGDELTPGGRAALQHLAGRRSRRDNTAEDGYLGTAPGDSYRPNGYGLYNMVGNVWEWCADWFSPRTTALARATTRRARRRRRPGHARRLVPVPRLVLQPLPRRRPHRPTRRTLHGNIGFRVAA